MNKSGLPCLTLAQKCKCIVASDGCGLRLGCALGMGRAQRQEGPSSFADQSERAVLKTCIQGALWVVWSCARGYSSG